MPAEPERGRRPGPARDERLEEARDEDLAAGRAGEGGRLSHAEAELQRILETYRRRDDALKAHEAAAAVIRSRPLAERHALRRTWYRMQQRLQRFGHRYDDPLPDSLVFQDIPLAQVAKAAKAAYAEDGRDAYEMLRHVTRLAPWPAAAAAACACADVARGDHRWGPHYLLKQRMRDEGVFRKAHEERHPIPTPQDRPVEAWRNLIDGARWAGLEIPVSVQRWVDGLQDGRAPGRPAPMEVCQAWLAAAGTADEKAAVREKVLEAMSRPDPRSWFEAWNTLARRRKGLEEIPHDALIAGHRRVELALDLLHDEPNHAIPALEALGRVMEAHDWPSLGPQVMYLLRRAGKPTVHAILEHVLPRLHHVDAEAYEDVRRSLSSSRSKRDLQAAAVLDGAALDKVRPPPDTGGASPPMEGRATRMTRPTPLDRIGWMRERAQALGLAGATSEALRGLGEALAAVEALPATVPAAVEQARIESELGGIRDRTGGRAAGLVLTERAAHRIEACLEQDRRAEWQAVAVGIYHDYSTLLMQAGRDEESRRWLHRAADHAHDMYGRGHGEKPFVTTLMLLANRAIADGEPEKALADAEQALAVARGIHGYQVMEANLEGLCASALFHQRELDTAWSRALRAVDLLEPMADRVGVARILAHALDRAAQVAMERHDWTPARELLDRAGSIHHDLAARDPADHDQLTEYQGHLALAQDLAQVEGDDRRRREAKRERAAVERALRGRPRGRGKRQR